MRAGVGEVVNEPFFIFLREERTREDAVDGWACLSWGEYEKDLYVRMCRPLGPQLVLMQSCQKTGKSQCQPGTPS
jgi:hypothetical protein